MLALGLTPLGVLGMVGKGAKKVVPDGLIDDLARMLPNKKPKDTRPRGEEIPSKAKSFNDARDAARRESGLGDDAVDSTQELGPFKGVKVTGRQSPDGKRGWRIDYDDKKGFHVNWWDHTGGSKRESWVIGAVTVEGGTYENFYRLIHHFPDK